MNAMTVVEENFGSSVRFHYVSETDKFYAHGSDLAKALLFKNPSDTLSRNVWKEYRFKIAVGVGQPAWWISEAGIYQMLFASDHPKAVDFQRWVFEEVLPKLRAEGGYISPSATQQQVVNLLKSIVDRLPNNKPLQDALALLMFGDQVGAMNAATLAAVVDESKCFKLEQSLAALEAMKSDPGQAGYYARRWGKMLDLPTR